MTSGRTRRIQFSRVRINSPAREDGFPEEESLGAVMPPAEPRGAYFYINWIAIAAHFFNAMAMTAIYAQRDQLAIPYTENLVAWTPKEENSTCPISSREVETSNNGVFCIGPKQAVFDCDGEVCALDYGALIISFHVLSFVFQLMAAVSDWDWFQRGWTIKCRGKEVALCKGCCGYKYSEMIMNSKNPLRFIEYSISASIMLMIIALINGISDIHLLFCIAILTASCQLCGLVVEYLDDKEQLLLKWVNHLNGWITFCSAYWCIYRAFDASVQDGKNYDPPVAPPDFVYAIVFALFALYASFGMVQLSELCCITSAFNCCCKNECCRANGMWQCCPALRKDDRCNPVYKEMVYVILSLAAKTVLGWILFINVLMA